jgi:hypothetical protein
MATSIWQRRIISDYLFSLRAIALTGRKSLGANEYRILLPASRFEFSAFGIKVSPAFAKLQELLARWAIQNNANLHTLLDIQRTATVFCPCKDEADWQYLEYLIGLYNHADPKPGSTGRDNCSDISLT